MLYFDAATRISDVTSHPIKQNKTKQFYWPKYFQQ